MTLTDAQLLGRLAMAVRNHLSDGYNCLWCGCIIPEWHEKKTTQHHAGCVWMLADEYLRRDDLFHASIPKKEGERDEKTNAV